MNAKVSRVTIVGASDPFVFELIEAAQAMGLLISLASTEKFISSQQSIHESNLIFENLEDMDKSSTIFTGEDRIPELQERSHSARAVEELRRLILVQEQHGFSNWINLIHPSAWISPSSELTRDIFVGANSSVGSFARIYDHVRVNRNVSIGHDVVIGEGSRIAPGSVLSSGSRVGKWSYLGAGSIILNDVSIGDGAVVGAGSVVTKDVLPGNTVLGVPARIQTEALTAKKE